MNIIKRFNIEYEGQATEHAFGPFMLYKDHAERLSRIRAIFVKIQNLPTVSGYSETYRLACDGMMEASVPDAETDPVTERLLLESELQDEKNRGNALLDGIREIYAMRGEDAAIAAICRKLIP